MTDLVVVGGLYREICREPYAHRELIGSGGRAAWVARNLGGTATLHTCVDSTTASDAEDWTSAIDVVLASTMCPQVPTFEYRHPLSRPTITPPSPPAHERTPLSVAGSVVLRFGMLEADPVVSAEIAVYDPQSAFTPESFSSNGSRATRLAVVANDYEARQLADYDGDDFVELVTRLRHVEKAEVAVLKCGAFGTWVAHPNGTGHIPCRVTERVWSLGSGDVFAAVFAQRWGIENADAMLAAEEASRGVAEYVNTRYPPSRESLADSGRYPTLDVSPSADARKVYLAAPFFTMAQRWLIDELRDSIPRYLRVFSPLHDVGRGPAAAVAPADLRALEESAAVIAVLDGDDPGTLFEVGYARALGIPVVVLAETVREVDLVMFDGTSCTVTSDLCTAVYHVVWCALRAIRVPARNS